MKSEFPKGIELDVDPKDLAAYESKLSRMRDAEPVGRALEQAFLNGRTRKSALDYIASGLTLLFSGSKTVTRASLKHALSFKVALPENDKQLKCSIGRLGLPNIPVPILGTASRNTEPLESFGILRKKSPVFFAPPEIFQTTAVPEFVPIQSGWNPFGFLFRRGSPSDQMRRVPHYFSSSGLMVIRSGSEKEWIGHGAEQLMQWVFPSISPTERELLTLLQGLCAQMFLGTIQDNGYPYDWNYVEHLSVSSAAGKNRLEQMRLATAGVRRLQRMFEERDVMLIIRAAKTLDNLAAFLSMKESDISRIVNDVKARVRSRLSWTMHE